MYSGTLYRALVVQPQPVAKLPQAVDPKELHQEHFAVIRERNTVDLSLWTPTPSNLVGNRVAPEKRTLWLEVVRRSEGATHFLSDIYTSSNPAPDLICFTHPWEFREIDYTPETGAPALKKYQVLIDISKVPLDTKFEIKFQYIVWNPNRGTTQSWAELGIFHETDMAELETLFPRQKPATNGSFHFSFAPLYRPWMDFIPSVTTKLTSSPERLVWTLDKPDIKNQHRYRIQWQW